MPTPVCGLLGIEQPIVLAPMVAVPALAEAVSNAGGLGMPFPTFSEIYVSALKAVHDKITADQRQSAGR